MSVRTKLLLAQVPLALALAFLGIFVASTLASLARHSTAMLHDNHRSVLAIERMTDAAERLERATATALLGGAAEPADVQAGARQRFESELQVQEHNITEPGEREATQSLRAAWTAYQQQLTDFPAITDHEAARRFFLDRLEPALTAVRRAADTILALNQQAIANKSDEAQAVAERTSTLLTLVVVLVLVGGGLLSITIASRLLRPLALLAHAVQQIGEGDFEARVSLPGDDELAQLGLHVNALATRLGQYRRSSLGELLLAQQTSQAALDSVPDPIVVFDAQGHLLNLNRAAETTLALTLGTAGGDPLDALAADVRGVLRTVRDHVLAGKGAYQPKGFDEALRLASDDHERWLLPRASPVLGDNGALAGATVVLQDVTRLRRVDELRSDLVTAVADELQAPLASLRLAVHVCLEQSSGPLTEAQADVLYAARTDCERLQSIVDELVQLAGLQRAGVQLDPRPTAPAALIDAVLEAERAAARERPVELATRIAPDLPPVHADPQQAGAALRALLANAIRRSPPHETITIRALPGQAAVRFEIGDVGDPIPRELQSVVFSRFVPLPGGVSVGDALPLSAARAIVEAHGGSVGVESGGGRDTTFWLTLPVLVRHEDARSAV